MSALVCVLLYVPYFKALGII